MFFRNHTVHSALSGLTKAIRNLEAAAKRHTDRMDHHEELVQFHGARANEHADNAERAAIVAAKIAKLIDA